MADSLKGKLVKVPASTFPEDTAPPEGYWVAAVVKSVDKYENTWLKVKGEDPFYRPTTGVASWDLVE